jgi:hypothetical protein
MAMGTGKQRDKQEGLWIAHTELATSPWHPFDAALYGRSSLTPGSTSGRCRSDTSKASERSEGSLAVGVLAGVEALRGQLARTH